MKAETWGNGSKIKADTEENGNKIKAFKGVKIKTNS